MCKVDIEYSDLTFIKNKAVIFRIQQSEVREKQQF